MTYKTGYSERAKTFWIRYRWIVLAVVGFLSAAFEFIEFALEPSSFGNPRYDFELILQGVIVPILLIAMQRTERQKNAAINELSLRDILVDHLNRAQNWDELLEIIGQFPRNILPLTGICLLIRAPESDKFDVELAQIFDPSLQLMAPGHSLELTDTECCQGRISIASEVRVCNCQLHRQDAENKIIHRRFCLQLAEADFVVGLLHLYLPVSYKLSKDQEDVLESILPEIAMSLKEANLRRKDTLREAAFETERLHLASDLHDTLGQDLVYLRNKINLILENQSFRRPSLIKQELQQMSMVTEEATQTVRNILAATRPGQSTALDARLLSYAQAIGARADLNVSLRAQGKPQTPNPNMQFQLFLIFRELMSNIEKHAHAHQVLIDLIWSSEELTLVVCDDGSGFLDESIDKREHFGLTIIETRISEMGGHMLIVSTPNQGTRISVCLPLISERAR